MHLPCQFTHVLHVTVYPVGGTRTLYPLVYSFLNKGMWIRSGGWDFLLISPSQESTGSLSAGIITPTKPRLHNEFHFERKQE